MRNEMLIIGAGSIGSTLATRLLEDSNRGNNVVARGRWPLCIAVLPGQLVCLGLMLAVPAVWSTVMAAEKQEFVVRPDQAPHFSGPAGMERLITEVFAICEQTGGTFGIWRYEIKPEGGPPSHSHREEDEFFYVMGRGVSFPARSPHPVRPHRVVRLHPAWCGCTPTRTPALNQVSCRGESRRRGLKSTLWKGRTQTRRRIRH